MAGDLLVEFDLDGVWTDVTSRVISVRTRRASTQIRGVVRQYQAGWFEVQLHNVNPRYDPIGNPAVRPGMGVRISFDGGAGAVRAFTGALGDLDLEYWGGMQWSTIALTGNDAVVDLQRAGLPSAAAEGANDTVAERLDRCLDIIGWPEADRDISAGGVELIATTYNRSAWDEMQTAVNADPGDLWINPSNRVAFRPFADIVSTTPVATFSPTALQAQRLHPAYDRERLANRVQYARVDNAVATIDDTTSQELYTSGVPWLLDLPNLPHVDQDDADDLARIQLLGCSVPELRYDRIDLKLHGRPTVQQAVLDLDIGSRVAVEGYTPPGGGDPIELDGWVSGVEHRYTRGRRWECVVHLASASRFNFLRYDDAGATLDVAGFAPGLPQSFTGGRYAAVADELVQVDDWQRMADQAVYRFDDLAQQGDEFPAPHKGAFIYRADRGFLFFNGTTWLRPVG